LCTLFPPVFTHCENFNLHSYKYRNTVKRDTENRRGGLASNDETDTKVMGGISLLPLQGMIFSASSVKNRKYCFFLKTFLANVFPQ
jgi:hypothetical protein